MHPSAPRSAGDRARSAPALVALALLLACDRGVRADASAHAPAAAPAAPIAAPPAAAAVRAAGDDPTAVALRDFRGGLPPVDRLDGPATRDALVAAFVGALARRDTAALRALALDRREFAWLYYPSTPQALPPYALDAPTMWMMMQAQGDRGLMRLLRRWGGQPLRLVDHACAPAPQRQGPRNRVWLDCRVRLATAAGDTIAERLFGSVLERDGRFRLVSLANPL